MIEYAWGGKHMHITTKPLTFTSCHRKYLIAIQQKDQQRFIVLDGISIGDELWTIYFFNNVLHSDTFSPWVREVRWELELGGDGKSDFLSLAHFHVFDSWMGHKLFINDSIWKFLNSGEIFNNLLKNLSKFSTSFNLNLLFIFIRSVNYFNTLASSVVHFLKFKFSTWPLTRLWKTPPTLVRTKNSKLIMLIDVKLDTTWPSGTLAALHHSTNYALCGSP